MTTVITDNVFELELHNLRYVHYTPTQMMAVLKFHELV